ncbi:MAG: hypothetical protein R2762_06150 [Bryobacteraceae bacterium]
MNVAARLDELARADSPALFGEIIEPLCDSFEPDDADRYAELFLPVIARTLPQAEARRATVGRRFSGPDPSDVFVLSRVTLGADVAVSSVVMDAAKRRFPRARIHMVGPRKNYELFAGDARVEHAPVEYGRAAGLRERLSAGLRVREIVDRPGAIVIDADSRLTQLGLIPVTGEDRYFFWESRSYRPESVDPLGRLAAAWMGEAFGVEEAFPYVAPAAAAVADWRVCVSLGVGGNMAKRVDDRFEAGAMQALVAAGGTVGGSWSGRRGVRTSVAGDCGFGGGGKRCRGVAWGVCTVCVRNCAGADVRGLRFGGAACGGGGRGAVGDGVSRVSE